MSYFAEVFNVMTASPGDVQAERAIIRDVIYEWNAVHSKTKEIVLLPIGWETHSSPEMGSHPQSIINKQVLEKCDVLIGVFWTRIGTPTKDYNSGTVEEIERHINSGKPVMLYFSNQPISMDEVDKKQHAELEVFKASCKERGLYHSYKSLPEFREVFYRHLQLKINDDEFFQVEDSEGFSEVVESKTKIPDLSKEAQILLKEASLDKNGTVLFVEYIGGSELNTNNKNLIPSNERREVAKWESALQELVQKGLLISRGYKNQIFDLSNFGYQVADMISI